MNKLTPKQFVEFYEAVNGFEPFPWHVRLAERVCEGDWPRAIALPTAAGKTMCIDIALFALACGAANAARRIFFVVDRRIVVDYAYDHAKKLAKRLRDPAKRIEQLVADALRDVAYPNWRSLSDDQQDKIHPLDVYALRGGMYRESAWTHSPLQPTVIASTVDQVGSRLLFRGYGVSDSMKPIHAGLVGNDSLILLDEAHCAKPFDETMQAVKAYRAWHVSKTPLTFVSITATPATEDDVMRADKADEKHPVLGKRMRASKPATLVIATRAKGKNSTVELVKVLKEQAVELAKEGGCVGIIVNRVKTARELRDSLKKEFGHDVVLLTGRMRPLDRDRIYEERLKSILSNPEGEDPPPKFVIGTQCLECGADFDFHALVTECASLDALRQRFGRLNRVAKRPNAESVIVIRGDQIDAADPDSVYGESLAKTWNWLNGVAADGVVDFGVAAMRTATVGVDIEPLNAPTESAPVLFPAHLDCWVQTNPIPTPDPDPALFLHGPKRPGQPDVQVVFRADLGDNADLWNEIVTLCPPSTSEAVAVPISVFKKWIAGEGVVDQSSDLEGETIDDEEAQELSPSDRKALCWRGPEKSEIVADPVDVHPNQVYVIPCSSQDVAVLADFISEVPADYAEEAFQRSRDKALLRLLSVALPADAEEEDAEITSAIQALRATFTDETPLWRRRAVDALALPKDRQVDIHPRGGVVVTGKRRLHAFDPTYLDDSEPAESYRGRPISLESHSRGVAEFARRFADSCSLDAELYYTAGLFHDLGKLDPRFQAMLKQCSPRTAVGEAWAKSLTSSRTTEERNQARLVHHYPRGGRHELLSAALLQSITSADLLLHLVATHHGSGRPFANAVEEGDIDLRRPFAIQQFFAQDFRIESSCQDIADWNVVLPERFWRVIGTLGWWGSAYHEAVFRLADHAQSRKEQESTEGTEKRARTPTRTATMKEAGTPIVLHPLPLVGLDGSNPLAYLAALGTLQVCDQLAKTENRPDWLESPVRLSWGTAESPYAVLHLSSAPPSKDEFVQFILDRMPRSVDKHAAAWVISMLEHGSGKDAVRDFDSIKRRVLPQRVEDRGPYDWITALSCESAIDADSQLQTVRCDYLIGNLKSLMQVTAADHLRRSLFATWDYADGLANQSLHWEPTEDRRHAYQWYMPSGDPTRKNAGGMVGANRLALEAWPLFPSFPDKNDRVNTRGFRGNRANNTYWSWPLWSFPATAPVIGSLLSLTLIHERRDDIDLAALRQLGIIAVFRSQRILVGKTPNLTTAIALA